MAESPKLIFRVAEKLAAKLQREAKKRNKTTSETARELLSEALNSDGLAAIPKQGRKKLSENPKNV